MKWTEAFKIAEKYYTDHGDLLVPKGYILDGLNLYNWISNQRRRYPVGRSQSSSQENQTEKKNQNNQENRENPKGQKEVHKAQTEFPLTEDQISALESIGMVWNAHDYAWERAFAVAEAYYKEHGNLIVPLGYVQDGVDLSMWIRTQRQIRKGSLRNRKEPLTDEQIRRLDSIGMPWEPYNAVWERSFAVAEKYYREHGNLIVPKHYEEDGVNLSHWIWTQRRIANGTKGEMGRPLTEEQKRRLEEIGMDWAPKSKGFSYYYGLVKKFYDAYGHTDFPDGEVMVAGEVLPESGEALAAWKLAQEQGDFLEKSDGRAKEKRALLHEIGMCLDHGLSPWERKYRVAEQYYREHGDLLVPFAYVTEDGVQLGKWISNQRIKRRGVWGTPPTEEQIRKLDAIGMSWDETENRGKRKRPWSRKKTEDGADQAEGDTEQSCQTEDGGTEQADQKE